MINQLLIENFKCLKQIEMKDIPQVTLIGGKNNSGKSTLLEAIFLFFDRIVPEMPLKHLAWRGIQTLELEPEKIWTPLFYNFDIRNNIRLKLNKEIMTIAIDRNYRPKNTNEKGIISLSNVANISNPENLSLSVKITENNNELFRSHFVLSGAGMGNNIEKNESKLNIASYLSNKSYNSSELIKEFSKIDENGETNELVDALMCIDEKLENLSVNIVGGNPGIYAKIRDIDRKIPVALMGDGINRLLAIIIKIKACRDGVFLIDEVENGFHCSSLNNIWNIIRELSLKYNCQIFATTHSYECVTKACESFEKSKNSFQYVRMAKNSEGAISPKSFNYETLSVAIENDMEVR